jgi:hypothetical protein
MKPHHILATLLATTAVARAGETLAPEPMTNPGPTPAGWEFTVALYAPLMGLDGDIGVAGLVPANVDIGFDDILDNLDGGLSGAIEARRGPWSVSADAIWLKMSASTQPTANSYLALSQEQLMGSVAIGYDVYRSESTRLEVVAGAAINSIEADIDLFTPRLPRPVRSGSGSQTWIDPIVGVRVQQRLGERWGLFGGFTFGSFDVSSSEYWQGVAGIAYHLSDATSIALAYRVLSVDYQQGGFVYDTQTSGPNIGLLIRF